jgi:hypothetical protein
VSVRGSAVLVVLSLVIAVADVLLADPEQPWAVAVLIVSLGVAVGAGAFAWQLRSPTGRRRGPRPRRADVLRRAAGIGAIAALLLWLRAVDGLSILTAAFVIGSFVLAELVLTTRPQSSR